MRQATTGKSRLTTATATPITTEEAVHLPFRPMREGYADSAAQHPTHALNRVLTARSATAASLRFES